MWRTSKKLLAILLLLSCLISNEAGARQAIGGVSEATIAASTTVYSGINQFSTTYPTTDAIAYEVIPTGGTLDLLAMRPTGSPSTTTTGTLYLNGSPTSLTCGMSTNVICHDSTHSVAVVAGDKVSFQITTSAAATTRGYSWSFRWTPTINGENILLGNTSNTAPANNNFLGVCSPAAPNAAETQVRHIMPETSAVLKKLYVKVDTDPTTALSSIAFTVQNASAGGNVTCSIATGSTSCNDTTHTDTIAAAGDVASFKIVGTLLPTYSPVHWGLVYLTPTSGNFITCASTGNGGLSTGSRNIPVNGYRSVTTGTLMANVTNAFTYKALFARIETAPGAGTTYGLRLFVAGSSVGSTLSLADTNTAANNSQNTAINLDDVINFNEIATVGSPNTTGPWKQTMIGNIADPVSANNSGFLLYDQ